jgi:hypothetical protein
MAEDERPPDRRRSWRRLEVPGRLAAVLTGAVVGLVLVGLTAAGQQLCTVVRGTSSCGTPGLFLVLVIVALVIALGALLLRLLGVETPLSTSLLGVALLDIVILLALLPVVERWWMVIAIPVLAMLTFPASYWLTSTFAPRGEHAP